jgi:CheY-like chemotaxis protein
MAPDDSHDAFIRLDGVHMLVVDDNADARIIYKQILLYAGASVLVVNSATAAVKSLRHVRPDAVLSDLSMPRRDGLWLIDWIRKRDTRRGGHLPVIAVTARDDLYMPTTAERMGFDAYLTKPVPPRELFRTIARLTPPASPRRTETASA